MRTLTETFKKIYHEDKGFLGLVFLVLFLALLFIVHALLRINAAGALNYVGYGDIGKFVGGDFLSLWNSGGYRSGGAVDLMAFPVLGLVVGVFHNLLAVRIYKRRGSGIAKAFLFMSVLILIGAFIVLTRLLGEG